MYACLFYISVDEALVSLNLGGKYSYGKGEVKIETEMVNLRGGETEKCHAIKEGDICVKQKGRE